jgi:hypothetical protein
VSHHAILADCLIGPDLTITPGCGAVDLDGDGHIPLDDFGLFHSAFGQVSGP